MLGRFTSFFKKPKCDLDILSMVDNEFGLAHDKQLNIRLTTENMLLFRDFLQRVMHKDCYAQDQGIIWSMRSQINSLLDKLWFPIETATTTGNSIDIMYSDGYMCTGKCIKLGACSSGRVDHYFVPYDASTAEALECIKLNDLPTRWRKRSHTLTNSKRIAGGYNQSNQS